MTGRDRTVIQNVCAAFGLPFPEEELAAFLPEEGLFNGIRGMIFGIAIILAIAWWQHRNAVGEEGLG